MNQQEMAEKLVSEFGEEVVKLQPDLVDQVIVMVDSSRILDVCNFLRNSPALAFDFLSFVAGVDRYPQQPRFEVVYQLQSLKQRHRFRIKTLISESEESPASVDSVVGIWPTADWHERETAEMFGIVFNNHPDPRKLLLPENWKVFPLRKDFPLQGSDELTPDLPA